MDDMKKTKKTMDIVLIVIAIVLITFTIANLVIFTIVGHVPDILITSVFTACLGEFGFMAWIKNTKEENKNNVDGSYIDQNTYYDNQEG